MIRSAYFLAKPTEWMLMSTVVPSSWFMRLRSVRIVSEVTGSREATGSSASTILACWTRVRAMATRCCWPPLSWSLLVWALSARPTVFNASSISW